MRQAGGKGLQAPPRVFIPKLDLTKAKAPSLDSKDRLKLGMPERSRSASQTQKDLALIASASSSSYFGDFTLSAKAPADCGVSAKAVAALLDKSRENQDDGIDASSRSGMMNATGTKTEGQEASREDALSNTSNKNQLAGQASQEVTPSSQASQEVTSKQQKGKGLSLNLGANNAGAPLPSSKNPKQSGGFWGNLWKGLTQPEAPAIIRETPQALQAHTSAFFGGEGGGANLHHTQKKAIYDLSRGLGSNASFYQGTPKNVLSTVEEGEALDRSDPTPAAAAPSTPYHVGGVPLSRAGRPLLDPTAASTPEAPLVPPTPQGWEHLLQRNPFAYDPKAVRVARGAGNSAAKARVLQRFEARQRVKQRKWEREMAAQRRTRQLRRRPSELLGASSEEEEEGEREGGEEGSEPPGKFVLTRMRSLRNSAASGHSRGSKSLAGGQSASRRGSKNFLPLPGSRRGSKTLGGGQSASRRGSKNFLPLPGTGSRRGSKNFLPLPRAGTRRQSSFFGLKALRARRRTSSRMEQPLGGGSSRRASLGGGREPTDGGEPAPEQGGAPPKDGRGGREASASAAAAAAAAFAAAAAKEAEMVRRRSVVARSAVPWLRSEAQLREKRLVARAAQAGDLAAWLAATQRTQQEEAARRGDPDGGGGAQREQAKLAEQRQQLNDWAMGQMADTLTRRAKENRGCCSCISRATINKWQDWAWIISSHPFFNVFIILMIVVNAAVLAINIENRHTFGLDVFVTVVFVLEIVLRVMALGKGFFFILWNWLDVVVVLESVLSITVFQWLTNTGDLGLNLTFLRALRLLRPLRTVSMFPNVRIITTAMIKSIKPLGQIVAIFVYFLFFSALCAVALWGGGLDARCGFEVASSSWSSASSNEQHAWSRLHNEQVLELGGLYYAVDAGMVCGLPLPGTYPGLELLDQPYGCEDNPDYPVCLDGAARGGVEGSDGARALNSFDTIPLAAMNLFTVATLSGWSERMWAVQSATGQHIAIIFFVLFIMVGPLILLNLMTASVLIQFNKAKELNVEYELLGHYELMGNMLNMDEGEEYDDVEEETKDSGRSPMTPTNGKRSRLTTRAALKVRVPQEFSYARPALPSRQISGDKPAGLKRIFSKRRMKSGVKSAMEAYGFVQQSMDPRHMDQSDIMARATSKRKMKYDLGAEDEDDKFSRRSMIQASGYHLSESGRRLSRHQSGRRPSRSMRSVRSKASRTGSRRRMAMLGGGGGPDGTPPPPRPHGTPDPLAGSSGGERSLRRLSSGGSFSARRSRAWTAHSGRTLGSVGSVQSLDSQTSFFAKLDLAGRGARTSVAAVVRPGEDGVLVDADLYEGQWGENASSLCSSFDERLEEYGLFHSGDWSFHYGVANTRWRKFVADENGPFELFVTGLIVLNCVTLAMDGERLLWAGMQQDLYTANVVLTMLFCVEMVMKLYVLGLYIYLKSWSNRLDFLIVVGSLVDTAMESRSTGVSTLRLVRLFRVLRVARLARRSEGAQRLMAIILESGQQMLPILFLFLLFIFIVSVLGVQLFGGEMDGAGGGEERERIRFDNFLWSFQQCFYVMMGENWDWIMLSVMELTGNFVGAACFFIFCNMVGQYFFLNLILAIILEDVSCSMDHQYLAQEQRIKMTNIIFKFKVSRAWQRWSTNVGMHRKRMSIVDYRQKLKIVRRPSRIELGSNYHSSAVVGKTKGNDAERILKIINDDPRKQSGSSRAASIFRISSNTRMSIFKKEPSPPKAKHIPVHTSPTNSSRRRMSILDFSHLKIMNQGTMRYWIHNFMKSKKVKHAFMLVVLLYTLMAFFPQDLVATKTISGICVTLSVVEIILKFAAFGAQRDLRFVADRESIDPLQVPSSGLPAESRTLSRRAKKKHSKRTTTMGSLLNEVGAKRKKKGKKSTYRRPFFSSKWNYADSLIVLGQFLTTILVTAGWLAPGSAPALLFEALRPARLVPRIQQLKDLNQSVLASMTSITNLLNIILLLMFIYALAGMQLFKGMFYHCEDPAFPGAAPLDGVVDAGTGVWTAFPCRGNWTDPATNRTEYRDYEWGRPTFHFDSVFNSLLNVYVMSTLSGWLPVLFDAMDTTEFHYSPEVNHSPASFLYFFIGIFFFGFYFTNLFIGVVFQKFLGSKTVGEDGLLKSQEDRQWQDYKKRLEVVPLMKAHIRPANFPFNLIFDFVQSFLMRGVIFILLATNIIFVCIYLDPSGGEEKEAFLKKTNMAFFWIFLFVEVFRIASLGLFTYLDAKANQFIFFSVFISIVDVLFQASRPDVSYYYSTVTRLVLISTFVRLTRIIQFFSGIRVYRVAVLHHARILLTIVSMIGIGIFFYACLGVVLFEGVDFDPSMRYANFDSLGGAMQLLLSVATSDMWSEVFMATTLEDGATSEVLVILYFVSFVFVKLFILLNLFIMVICEIFELLENPERVEIELQIQAYREAWSKYDPLASGRLRGPADLWGLYYDLDKPLGAGPAPTLLYTKFRVDIMTQQPGFALGFHEVLVFMVALGGVPSSFSHLLEDAGLAVRTFGPIVLLQRCLRRYIRVFRRRKKERLSVKWEKAKRRISQGSVTMSSPRPQEQALGRRSSFNAGAGRRGSFQRRGSSTHLDNSRVSVRGSGSVKAAHAPLGENNWENWKKLSIFQH